MDSLNHVKGFRYELWCAARAAGAAHAVVWCPRRAPASARPAHGGGWPDALADELARREEAPDPRHRWDAPLFAAAVDGASPTHGGPAPPALPAGARGVGGEEPAWALDAVAAAVVAAVCGGGGGGAAQPPALAPAISTTGARSAPADGLADLDATLQAVVTAVAAAASHDGGGGGGTLVRAPPPLTHTAADGAEIVIRLTRPLPLAELRRAKRDYLRAVTAPLAGAPPRGGAAARGFAGWLERVSEGGR